MQALLAPLTELAEYSDIKKGLQKNNDVTAISGCVDSQKLHMLYGLAEGIRYKIIVTYSDLRAREIFEEYSFYDRNVLLYPAKDLIFFQADIHGNQLTKERIRVLRRLSEKKPVTIITTFAALMSPQVMWEEDKDILRIEKGSILEERRLAEKLVSFGYEKTYQVEAGGQFSIRGGIVDIFDLTEENPYRIELWGDEVDSIRSFDVLSQRSVEKLSGVTIYPATEFILEEDRIRQGLDKLTAEAKIQEEIFRKDHMPEEAHRIATQVKEFREQLLEFRNLLNIEGYIRYFYEELVTLPEILLGLQKQEKNHPVVFFLDEPAHIESQMKAVELEFRESMEQRVKKGYILPGQMQLLCSGEYVVAKMAKAPVITLSMMETRNSLIQPDKKYGISARSIVSYNNSFESLVKDLKQYRKNGYRVLLLSGSRTRAKRLAEDLRDNELAAVYSEDPFREVQPGEVLTYYGHVKKGFEYPLLKFVVISESDIFGKEKKKKKRKLYQGQKINDFNELKVAKVLEFQLQHQSFQ